MTAAAKVRNKAETRKFIVCPDSKYLLFLLFFNKSEPALHAVDVLHQRCHGGDGAVGRFCSEALKQGEQLVGIGDNHQVFPVDLRGDGHRLHCAVGYDELFVLDLPFALYGFCADFFR